jgi:hypothetical protein
MSIAERFTDPSVQKGAAVDLALVVALYYPIRCSGVRECELPANNTKVGVGVKSKLKRWLCG